MKYLLGLLLALCVTSAEAQQTSKLCFPTGTGNSCQDVTSTHPFPVTGTFTPAGNQSVNITQILGAAPSLTNPLWVFPATGGTWPTNLTQINGTAISASNPLPTVPILADTTGTGTITIVDSGSSTASGQGGSAIVTGTATAGSFVTIAITGRATVATLISGTWTGTVAFESSTDSGTTWTTYSTHVKGAISPVSTATANGLFLANAGGTTNYRVRATAAVTGTINIRFDAANADSVVYVNNAISIVDGANGLNKLTVKSASTPAVAGDTSAVVTLSPNSAGPLGSLTNRSSTITSGGTAQTLASTNSARRYLLVENPCAQTESLWINFTTAAVVSQPSVEISPCGSFLMSAPNFVSTELISVIATTTSHPFIAKEN